MLRTMSQPVTLKRRASRFKLRARNGTSADRMMTDLKRVTCQIVSESLTYFMAIACQDMAKTAIRITATAPLVLSAAFIADSALRMDHWLRLCHGPHDTWRRAIP